VSKNTPRRPNTSVKSRAAGLIGGDNVQKLANDGIVLMYEDDLAKLQADVQENRASRLERELGQERQAGADASLFASTVWPYLQKWAEEIHVKSSGDEQVTDAELQLWQVFVAIKRYETEQTNLHYASPRISPLQRLEPHLRGFLDVVRSSGLREYHDVLRKNVAEALVRIAEVLEHEAKENA